MRVLKDAYSPVRANGRIDGKKRKEKKPRVWLKEAEIIFGTLQYLCPDPRDRSREVKVP